MYFDNSGKNKFFDICNLKMNVFFLIQNVSWQSNTNQIDVNFDTQSVSHKTAHHVHHLVKKIIKDLIIFDIQCVIFDTFS